MCHVQLTRAGHLQPPRPYKWHHHPYVFRARHLGLILDSSSSPAASPSVSLASASPGYLLNLPTSLPPLLSPASLIPLSLHLQPILHTVVGGIFLKYKSNHITLQPQNSSLHLNKIQISDHGLEGPAWPGPLPSRASPVLFSPRSPCLSLPRSVPVMHQAIFPLRTFTHSAPSA